MKMYLKISRFSFTNATCCYHVETSDYGTLDFVIGIDKKEKVVTFYKNKEQINSFGTIHFNQPDKPIKIPGIPGKVVAAVVTRAREVFESEGCPDNLDYYS